MIIVPISLKPSINIPALSKLENPIGPSIFSNPFFFPKASTVLSRALLTDISSIKSNHPNLTLFFLICFTSNQLIIAAILPTIFLFLYAK